MEFNVLALQETRAKRSPAQEQPDYWTFSAEADPRGCYGAQLAFAKDIPYGTTPCGRPLYWTMKHFRIVASTPRYLAILVDAPALKLLCISAHAPHGGAELMTKQCWIGGRTSIKQFLPNSGPCQSGLELMQMRESVLL